MTDYIRKSSGMDKTLKRKIKYILADYDRMKRDRLDILYGSANPADGMPRASGVGKPTERKAERLAAIESELQAIDQTCVEFRGEMSRKTREEFDPLKAYWNYDYYNYMHRRTSTKPEGPSSRTWHRFKDRLEKRVAEKLNYF